MINRPLGFIPAVILARVEPKRLLYRNPLPPGVGHECCDFLRKAAPVLVCDPHQQVLRFVPHRRTPDRKFPNRRQAARQ